MTADTEQPFIPLEPLQKNTENDDHIDFRA